MCARHSWRCKKRFRLAGDGASSLRHVLRLSVLALKELQVASRVASPETGCVLHLTVYVYVSWPFASMRLGRGGGGGCRNIRSVDQS